MAKAKAAVPNLMAKMIRPRPRLRNSQAKAREERRPRL